MTFNTLLDLLELIPFCRKAADTLENWITC